MRITAALFVTPGCNHRCTHAKGGHVVTTQPNPFSKIDPISCCEEHVLGMQGLEGNQWSEGVTLTSSDHELQPNAAGRHRGI